MMQPGPSRMAQIETWIRGQMEQVGAAGLVVELTGGIRSTVVAALAAKAAPGKVLAVICRGRTGAGDLADAELAARCLALQPERIDLEPVFEHMQEHWPDVSARLLEACSTRLSMSALFILAETHRYLVLGHLCRTDWEIGRFTRFGDAAADLQPLLHLLYRDVLGMAAELDLPARILARQPSLGALGPGPKDEHVVFTYPQVDAFLADQLSVLPETLQFKIREAIARTEVRRQPPCSLSSSAPLSALDYDRSIEALTLISKAITSDQYVEDILRLIVMVTAEVMNSSVCSLWLLNEKEQVLRLRATQSINRDYLKERVLHVGEGVVGRVVRENRPVSILDVLTDPHFKEKELAQKMGLVSMLSIPMRVKDRVIGVINCYTSHPHEFTELQVNILITVANQAAVAIENTELLVQTRVIEEELAARKIIERAKDLIIDRLHLSGEEAYRWLRKRSMDTRKSMREVAEAVLLTIGN